MREIWLQAAVEGITDAAAVSRLCTESGLQLNRVFSSGGKRALDRSLPGYNAASRIGPWLVLRDLDHDAECAPDLVERLVPESRRSPGLVLRIPIRSLEAWLIADRDAIARFLAVRPAAVPPNPETLPRPKRTLVDLARQSRKRQIRQDMVPAEGTSAEVGPGYTSRLIEFISQHWDPVAAAMASDSLARCLRALRKLAETGAAS